MRKFFLFLAIFVITKVTFAQSSYFEITESETYKDVNRLEVVEAIYTTPNEEIIIASSGKRTLAFEMLNTKAEKLFNKTITLDKKETVVDYIQHDDLLKIFTIYKPSKTEREVRCHILNIKDRTYSFNPLFNTTVEKKQLLFSGQNKRQTNWAVSPNGQFFAVATDNIKKNTNSYDIRLYYSDSMELIYKKTYFENKEKFFTSFDMTLDDLGNIYSIGKEYKEGKQERDNGKPNYVITINKISKETIKTNRIDLDVNNHIADLKIIQKEKELQLYGFYSEQKAGRISGLTKFTVSKENLAILTALKSKLPEEIFKDIYKDTKVEKKKKKDLNNYYLDYIIEDDDGNTTLLAEQFYITQVYISNGQYGGYFQTVFNYDNVLVLKLDNTGEVLWGRSIFKKANNPSYNAFVLDNNLHVFFNSGKNLKKKEDGRVKAKKGWLEGTSLYNYSYTKNGEVSQEKIRDNKNRDLYAPYLGSYQNRKFIMLNNSNGNKKVMILKAK